MELEINHCRGETSHSIKFGEHVKTSSRSGVPGSLHFIVPTEIHWCHQETILGIKKEEEKYLKEEIIPK